MPRDARRSRRRATDRLPSAAGSAAAGPARDPATDAMQDDRSTTTVLSIDEAIDQVRDEQATVVETPTVTFDPSKPRVVKPVPIELDQLRHLRLPFWALKRFQDVTGISPWDHAKVWGYPPDIDVTVTMIWAALLEESPDITLEEVWRLPGMELGNMPYLRNRLDLCWGRSNPDADESNGAAGDAHPNPPGAGPSSTG